MCGLITSTHYFHISQAQDDLQWWILLTDRLGAICCSHNAASSCANQRKSGTNDPQHNSNWDYPFDQVHSFIAATNSTL